MLSPRMHGRQESALAGLALTLCLACALPVAAQLDRHRNGPPPPAEEEKIAALDAHTSTLPVLDAGEMSAADRALLQQREVDVSSAAAFYGFDISDSHWTYQQIVCRSLPDHMMLSFENDSVEHGAVALRCGGASEWREGAGRDRVRAWLVAVSCGVGEEHGLRGVQSHDGD